MHIKAWKKLSTPSELVHKDWKERIYGKPIHHETQTSNSPITFFLKWKFMSKLPCIVPDQMIAKNL
jgi:hypothetical protein